MKINDKEKPNKKGPPKKQTTNKADIKIILEYSAKKNNAKNKEEYSTL
jgi:hypothetical protein